MNKFISTIIFFLFAIKLSAQVDTKYIDIEYLKLLNLKRVDYRLTSSNTPEYLNDTQIQFMLSEQQFIDYKKAKKEYVTSIPLLSVGSLLLAGATMYIVALLPVKKGTFGADLFRLVFIPTFSFGIVFLTSGIVLHCLGKKTLNRLVSDYNAQHLLSSNKGVNIKIGFISSGVGLQLDF
ncbi:MAG: hypothetical protein LBU51_01630 [Bacteroidales bacterium]|jgi:hypothetical protein|nr:hypothetical protein [Bacteroidales bacterium]